MTLPNAWVDLGMQKKSVGLCYVAISTIIVIIFLDFLILYKIFFSPQMIQSVVISDKHGIYELPRELQNNLRPRILGN